MPKGFFNPDSEKQRARLAESVRQSKLDLAPFLEQRNKFLAMYRGNRWRRKPYELMDRRPIPFIRQALDLYTQYLSGVRPRSLVVARDPSKQPSAERVMAAMNVLYDRIDFGRTLRMAAAESIGGFPMFKIAKGPLRSSSNEISDVPFCDVVLSPDVVIDLSTDSSESVEYIGNRYRPPVEWVLRNSGKGKLFRKDVARELNAIPRDARSASRGYTRPLHDVCELIDLYLPRDNVFMTIPAPEHHVFKQPLQWSYWRGPEGGPYVPIYLFETADEVLPVPPGWSWIDGDLAVNTLYVKLIEMAEDMKNVVGAQGNAVNDADRLVRARHGEVWRFDHPNNVREYRFGGPDQPVLSFAVHMRSLLSHYAGNIDLLSGAGAQSPTATQDALLAQQSSQSVEDMQQRMTDAVSRAMRKIGWYLFDRGTRMNIPIERRLGEVSISTRFNQRAIAGKRIDYDIGVEPYSMRYRSPQQRSAIIQGIMSALDNKLDMLLQQGATLDLQEFVRILAQYNDAPEVNRIIRRARQAIDETRKDQGMARATSRETVRRSAPRQSDPMDAINRLPGLGGDNNQQAA